MKVVVFIAILALAWADVDDKKPEEKKEEERRGLQWPLPEWRSEGDLIQHGVHFYERVGELRKQKLDNDMDKMILSFGRNFLRKAHKYLEATPDFKILPILCRDSRNVNSTDRWEIRLHPEQSPVAEGEQANKPAQQQNDAPAETPKTQNDAPSHPKNINKPVAGGDPKPANASENATDAPVAKPDQQQPQSYVAQRADHYQRMGDNFAHLLLKHYRKEALIAEETEYINHWSDEEAIHYGVMGIYCHDGENVKEIFKKISQYVEEK